MLFSKYININYNLIILSVNFLDSYKYITNMTCLQLYHVYRNLNYCIEVHKKSHLIVP